MTAQDQYAKVVEIVEVIGAENAMPYIKKHWILLGVIGVPCGEDGHFRYSLGRPWDESAD